MKSATIDHETLTIRFERKLRAPREDVFDAWTRPEELAEWWDPTGNRLTKCQIDLRAGGTFTFENAGHGPPFTGVYRVVDRPGKLVFDALGSVGTVALTSEGETTRMKVEIRCSSAEHLQQFLKLGVDTDTGRTLDNLVSRLHGRAERSESAPPPRGPARV
jgi:uncharacterized protein YndB with AHSA1/START domain